MVDAPSQAEKGPPHVLVVEDEGLIRMMVTETLADAGFQVSEAATAKEALELIGTIGEGLSAIVLDVGLPDLNGELLLEKIRSLRPIIPVIMTTGYDTNELRRKAETDSHLRILTKPFQLELLSAALKEMGVGA